MERLTDLFLKYYDLPLFQFFSGMTLGLILAFGIRMIRYGLIDEEVGAEEEDDDDRLD